MPRAPLKSWSENSSGLTEIYEVFLTRRNILRKEVLSTAKPTQNNYLALKCQMEIYKKAMLRESAWEITVKIGGSWTPTHIHTHSFRGSWLYIYLRDCSSHWRSPHISGFNNIST